MLDPHDYNDITIVQRHLCMHWVDNHEGSPRSLERGVEAQFRECVAGWSFTVSWVLEKGYIYIYDWLKMSISDFNLALRGSKWHGPIRERISIEDELDKSLRFKFWEQNARNRFESGGGIITFLKSFYGDRVSYSQYVELRPKLNDRSPEIA